MELNKIYNESCLETMKRMPDNFLNGVITSPPYWGLRDYGIGKEQLGLESDFNLYIKHLCDIFDEVKRVLRDDGSCWIVIGDSYGGGSGGYYPHEGELGASKAYIKTKGANMPKCQIMIPERFAIEMINRGWILRNKIIWYKPNCIPSSVTDRFTIDFEYVYFFVKNKRYYFKQQFDKSVDPESFTGRRKRGSHQIAEKMPKYAHTLNKGTGKVGVTYPERNKRAVWQINTAPFPEAHFAVFPEELIIAPIKTMPGNAIVYDPFLGSGTTAVVAYKLNRQFIGSEINKEYYNIAQKRIKPLLQQRKLFK